MIISEVKARLKDISQLERIGGALSLAGINKQGKTPAAFVVPEGERASTELETIGATTQKNLISFKVVLVFKAKNSKSGIEVEDEIELIRNELKAKLVGWQPATEFEEIKFTKGDLVSLGNGFVVWADEFRSVTYIRG